MIIKSSLFIICKILIQPANMAEKTHVKKSVLGRFEAGKVNNKQVLRYTYTYIANLFIYLSVKNFIL